MRQVFVDQLDAKEARRRLRARACRGAGHGRAGHGSAGHGGAGHGGAGHGSIAAAACGEQHAVAHFRGLVDIKPAGKTCVEPPELELISAALGHEQLASVPLKLRLLTPQRRLQLHLARARAQHKRVAFDGAHDGAPAAARVRTARDESGLGEQVDLSHPTGDLWHPQVHLRGHDAVVNICKCKAQWRARAHT